MSRAGEVSGVYAKAKRALRLGALDATPDEVARIVVVNSIAVGSVLTCAIWAGVELFEARYWSALVSLLGGLWFAGVLGVQGREKNHAAAVMVSLGGVLLISFHALLTQNAEAAHLYLLVPVFVPFAVFPMKHRRSMLALSLLAFVSFAGWTAALAGQGEWLETFAHTEPSHIVIRDLSLVGLLMLIGYKTRAIRRVGESALEVERDLTEELISTLLPTRVSTALKRGDEYAAERHADVSVLFVELDRFDELCRQQWPGMVAKCIEDIHARFDDLCRQHGVSRVKASGDTYIVAVGVDKARPDHAETAAALALEMVHAALRYNLRRGGELQLRVGIDSGPVISGAIGKRRVSYDLWGDTVKRASKLCRYAKPSRVHVSQPTFAKINHRFTCELSENTSESDQGLGLRTYWLTGRREVSLKIKLSGVFESNMNGGLAPEVRTALKALE